MDRLRICFFFHRFDGGGAERMTVLLANELVRLEHEVSILIRHNKGPVKCLLNPAIHILDMGLPENGKLRKNFGNICWLRQVLRSGKFDVLLSVTAEMSQVAAFATYMLHPCIPLISVVHSTLSQEVHSFQHIREKLFPLLNRRYDRVITVSEAVREDYIMLCNALPEQVVTVYNPVINKAFWNSVETELEHPWLEGRREYKVIVLAGRFCEAKNHTLMLKTMKLLRNQGDFRLILLGDGELREQLEEQARLDGIREVVDFVGFVPNPASYFRKADVVALSSRFEGLPSVLVEALAVGAKVVSTDCPSGPREILEDGKFGILVEPGNPEAFANGILHALAWKPDREMLQQRALDFTDKRAAEGYLQVVRETIARHKGRRKHAQKTHTSLG